MDRLIALSLLICCFSCALFVPAERGSVEEITFHAPDAASVQLVGDWNEWGGMTGALGFIDPRCGLMENSDGTWTAELPDDLARGRYRYAFLVNGTEYYPDPLNPRQMEFRDFQVSLLIVD